MIEIRIVRWEVILWPNVVTGSFIRETLGSEWRRRREEGSRGGGGEGALLLALPVEEGAMSQEWAQPPNVGKGREVGSPREPPGVQPPTP